MKKRSGLTRVVSQSPVQMVKEGDEAFRARTTQEYLISAGPRGPVPVSAGPHLPARPSGPWGGLISGSHGEELGP